MAALNGGGEESRESRNGFVDFSRVSERRGRKTGGLPPAFPLIPLNNDDLGLRPLQIDCGNQIKKAFDTGVLQLQNSYYHEARRRRKV